MREIKFRAWDENNNELVYSEKEDCFYINTKGALFMYNNVKKNQYVKKYELMQYTGLKDKKGVEIYDGDILKITELETQLSSQETTIHKVEYIGSVFEIYPFLPYGRGRNDLLESTESKNYEVEVIGNIYENQSYFLTSNS